MMEDSPDNDLPDMDDETPYEEPEDDAAKAATESVALVMAPCPNEAALPPGGLFVHRTRFTVHQGNLLGEVDRLQCDRPCGAESNFREVFAWPSTKNHRCLTCFRS